MLKNINESLEKEVEKKFSKKDKRKQQKMKLDGAQVKKLEKIIKEKT